MPSERGGITTLGVWPPTRPMFWCKEFKIAIWAVS